jgi:release factor glutamine methyltransferase
MKLSEWLREAEHRLSSAGVESAKLEAGILAAHVLRVDRSWLFAHPEHDFNELAGEHVLLRRESREPLAYILGWREFYGRRFEVSPDVLIPRQDTETLVEAALERAGPDASVVDIGTGSGCIAITLKLERPELNVTAVDISGLALEVAKRNADLLDAKVEFVLSDRFENLEGQVFDMIVTNPPYIGLSEPLMPEVGDHEPALALYGGETGDEFLHLLAREAKPHLRDGGVLLTEVGHQQMSRTIQIFVDAGWSHESTLQDLSGIDRVGVFGI